MEPLDSFKDRVSRGPNDKARYKLTAIQQATVQSVVAAVDEQNRTLTFFLNHVIREAGLAGNFELSADRTELLEK